MSGGMRYGADENGNIRGVPFGGSGGGGIGDIVLRAVGQPRDKTLACDGSAVSREAYEERFAVIGETYGAGDGETTFNLPDCRDEFMRFSGTANPTGRKQTGTKLARYCMGSSSSSVATVVFDAETQESISYSNLYNYYPASYQPSTDKLGLTFRPHNIALYPCIIYED